MGEPFVRLREALGEVSDLGRAESLLSWDEQTKMPRAGAAARAEHLATLSRLHHRLLTSDDLGRLLDAAAEDIEGAAYESDEASIVRVARRDWEKARRVPEDLTAEIARAASRGQHAWAEARERSDFQAYLPHLRTNIELARRYAECMLGFEGCEDPYDALLDDYEPGMRLAALVPILEGLRDELLPLVADLPPSDPAEESSCLRGHFPVERQRPLARALAAELPLPEVGWRLDDSVHPFASHIGPGDVRLTTRYDEGYLGTAMWSVLHEGGHCLYAAGLPPELARTPLHRSVSLGFDESQSRLWENWVGRGRPYAPRLHARLVETFPESFEAVSADDVHAAANRFRRSLIRVEADEVTYNLHIVLRFELERELVTGSLDPAELPDAWNALVRSYLGLHVPDDASGVLQDIHWAAGIIGYFPTYSLGNVIAAQLFEQAKASIADLDSLVESGELRPLYGWLTERVHRHGGRFTSPEMAERTLGGLDPTALSEHLRDKLAGA